MILDNDVRKDDDLDDTDKAKNQTADGGKCVDEQLWRKAGCSAGAGGHFRLSSTWNAAKVNNPTPHQHTNKTTTKQQLMICYACWKCIEKFHHTSFNSGR